MLVALAVMALLGAACSGGDDSAEVQTETETVRVVLEPLEQAGADPFTPSVTTEQPDELPVAVAEAVDAALTSFDADDDTGTLLAVGDAPGLYGGVRGSSTCDVGALAAFLGDPENQDAAGAWTRVLGVDPEGIEEYLTTLTPTLLAVDTRVTNHGLSAGRAVPRQSVLQAGTAVLVDELGVPRVRCSCGNPLIEPDPVPMAAASGEGAWSGFSTERIVTPVPAAEPLGAFTLVDVGSGETFEQSVGSTLGATWVAVGRSDGDGVVHTSSDGVDWDTTATLPGVGLSAVAHAGGVFVAAGSARRGTADPVGVVVTSRNGRDWSDPVEAPGGIEDVAGGPDGFVAIGRPTLTEGTPVLISSDGSEWTTAPPAPTPAMGLTQSITWFDGRYWLLGLSCGSGRMSPGCEPWYLLESADGTAWSDATVPVQGIGFIGESIQVASSGDLLAIIGTSGVATLEDGTWVLAPSAPGLTFRAASGADGSWYLPASSDPASVTDTIYRSSDLDVWQAVGAPGGELLDVVVVGGAGVAVGSPRADVEPELETEPTPAQADVIITEQGFRAAGQEIVVGVTEAATARAALSAALGTPDSDSPAGSGVCEPALTSWGQLGMVAFSERSWSFGVFDAQRPAPGTVAGRVATDGGVRIGDPVEAFTAAHPAARPTEGLYGGDYWYLDTDRNRRGLVAGHQGGVITDLRGGAEDPADVADC